MTRTGKAGVLGAAVMLCVGTYCGSPEGEAGEGTNASAREVTPESVQAAPALNDAEIAAIVVAANSIDVRYGEIARERASDVRVRQFAEMMITDHTAVNESAGALVARLGVTPQENDVSRSLESSAGAMRESLSAKTGTEFDRAYIANEVTYHQAVLDALDELLIPNATNAELRQTLVGVRPAFAAHLQRAQSLQQSLGT